MPEMIINLEHTLTCGQVFRYRRDGNRYLLFAGDKFAECSQKGETAEICTEDADFFLHYFDAETDYNAVLAAVQKDEAVAPLAEKYKGLRLLRQDLWEMTVSFIVSQNNNIPRIQAILERLCGNFGVQHKHGAAFPTPQALAALRKEDLADLKCGYRDSYIIDAAQKFASGALDTEIILFGTIEEARQELYKIKGVGPKVADCILLFGAGRRDAFPVDTWMKKALHNAYGITVQSPSALLEFAENRFGEYAGYAQQYLFFGARNGDI